LKLLGSIVVDRKIGQRAAERKFRQKVYKAKFHVLGREGTIEGLHEIDIHQLTPRLRFESNNDRLRFEQGGRINGQQLQALRELTQTSADLLAAARNSKPEKRRTITSPTSPEGRKRKPSSFAKLKQAYDYALGMVGRTVIPAHHNYQVRLRRFLLARGVEANMEKNFVDVDFKLEGEHYIGEIKVTTYLTPQQAFRAAVGQVICLSSGYHT